MSKTPNYDTTIKIFFDTLQPGEQTCVLTGEKWLMTDEEIGWYRKFNVPPSKLHPRMRLRLLLGFVSGLALWWKPHAKTGKPILSFVHPDSPYQVLPDREWSNEDFLCQTLSLDLNNPFFPQLLKLAHSIPVSACRDDGSNTNSIGVDYIKCEDSYMVFNLCGVKRCFYPALSLYNEDCVDITNTKNSQWCYRTNRVNKMFDCAFSFESRDCLNSRFLFDCRNCENCFGATNKRNAKYIFFNQQLSKEEYQERLLRIDLSSQKILEENQTKFQSLMEMAVWPENFNVGSSESTGEYIEESTRCREGYWQGKSTDMFWCWISEEQHDSAFSTYAGWGSGAYYTCDVVGGSQLRFCFRCWRCINIEYCLDCYDCENCFGCVGLRKKCFCIFNFQYSENEYWQKVDELKTTMLARGEYGEYFPAAFSENGFEYSMGEAFFCYSNEELAQFRAVLFDPKRGDVTSSTELSLLDVDTIPDRLVEINEEIFVGKPILDSILSRPFSVTRGEMAFYHKQNYPFPREHFLRRLKALIRTSNSPEPENRLCANCSCEIISYRNSSFTVRRVFCKNCYIKFLEENN